MEKIKLSFGSFEAKRSHKSGFTLIEILVVIGIIAVLAGIVIIAVNPTKQFAQGRNTDRTSGVTSILNAIGQRMADNKGIFAGTFGSYTCPALPTTATNISSTSGDVNLSCLYPTYLPTSIPVDPTDGVWTDATNYNTKYTVKVDSIGRVTVCAPEGAEISIPGSTAICITR